MKEMEQLHDMQTFIPRDPNTLTQEEQKKVLLSLIFLKEKKNGNVEGCTCVNGAPQCLHVIGGRNLPNCDDGLILHSRST